MSLTQLSFGGVPTVSYCSRCNKPLTNPVSIQAGMGPICRGHGGKDMTELSQRSDFDDELILDTYLREALVLERNNDRVCTNVPHLVVHHSPNGFEFGYAGSGPADLALNVCQVYLNAIGYIGEKTSCFDGQCWSLAWVLHQDFKRAFIETAPREGKTIPFALIKEWFDTHITDDLKTMYAPLEDE